MSSIGGVKKAMETFERPSLLVPCVQELAKESLTTVPARYVRPDQDTLLTSDSLVPDVPTIDMEKVLSGDQTELKKLDSACREWGFFQVLNILYLRYHKSTQNICQL